MGVLKRLALPLVLFAVTTACADPEADVRAAVQALRDTSGYAWETTARQTTREYPDVKTPADLQEPAPGVDVKGRTQNDGFTEVTLLPSKRTVDVPVTAIVKSSVSAVANTPLGWMTRQEMRDSPLQNKTMPFEGKPVRLSRLFTVARRATDIETPLADLLGFLRDIKAYEETDGAVIGRMKPMAAQMLQEATGGRSTGELDGSVVFRLRDGTLTGFEVKLETEIPRAGREPIRAVTRWATTLSSIGTTTVSPPREALSKLTKVEEN